jgi:Arc/MetJ family transcription regulator
MAFVGNMGTSSGILNMRTTIEIDERLIRKAMRVSGAKTKRAKVEAALRLLVQTKAQAGMQRLRGKVDWDGNLEESRLGRVIR